MEEMKTAVQVDRGLWEDVQRRALEENRAAEAVVADALALYLKVARAQADDTIHVSLAGRPEVLGVVKHKVAGRTDHQGSGR